MCCVVHATPNAVSFLAHLPRRRRSFEAGGQLLFLPATGATVLPFESTARGWRCAVIADARRQLAALIVVLTDLEIETAAPVAAVGPDLTDPATFRQVWLARFWQDGGRVSAAEVIADLAENLTVEMDVHARRRLCSVTRLHPEGVRILLNKLVKAGSLSCGHSPDPTSWGWYTLTLPPAGSCCSAAGASFSGSTSGTGPVTAPAIDQADREER